MVRSTNAEEKGEEDLIKNRRKKFDGTIIYFQWNLQKKEIGKPFSKRAPIHYAYLMKEADVQQQYIELTNGQDGGYEETQEVVFLSHGRLSFFS